MFTRVFPFQSSVDRRSLPTHVSMCPSQKMVALTSKGNSDIFFFEIRHEEDFGNQISFTSSSDTFNHLSKKELKGLSRDPFSLLQLAVKTVDSGIIKNICDFEMKTLVEEILSIALDYLQNKFSNEYKKSVLRDFFEGEKLGFIEPTDWPGSSPNFREFDDEVFDTDEDMERIRKEQEMDKLMDDDLIDEEIKNLWNYLVDTVEMNVDRDIVSDTVVDLITAVEMRLANEVEESVLNELISRIEIGSALLNDELLVRLIDIEDSFIDTAVRTVMHEIIESLESSTEINEIVKSVYNDIVNRMEISMQSSITKDNQIEDIQISSQSIPVVKDELSELLDLYRP